jgi:hypothetical protein
MLFTAGGYAYFWLATGNRKHSVTPAKTPRRQALEKKVNVLLCVLGVPSTLLAQDMLGAINFLKMVAFKGENLSCQKSDQFFYMVDRFQITHLDDDRFSPLL